MSLLWLNDRECENPEFSGNKGANLAKLQRFGYKVPQGFCITGEVSEHEVKQALKNLASPWAVRSSSSAEDTAGLAFPGIFETVLGLTTAQKVMSAVKKVINSKNTQIVKRYADQNKIDSSQIKMAIVVQTLINPDCSGVAFSQNPVSGEESVVIEANWGLGETLVDGSVSPDYYEVNRDGEVIKSRIGTKKIKVVFESGKVKRIKASFEQRTTATLSNEMARKLALIIENIAKDFGSPQDVEWLIQDNEIYIVQSRPITTLVESDKAQNITFEKAFTREESLILVEIQYKEFNRWLSEIGSKNTNSVFCKMQDGLTETWFCNEAINDLINEIYSQNIKSDRYIKTNIRMYKQCVREMSVFEKRGYAHDLNELKEYLNLFTKVHNPLHVIFFTPFRKETPKIIYDLAIKARGEDAVFDNADLFIRDSIANIFPELVNSETFIGLKDLGKVNIEGIKKRDNNFFFSDGKYITVFFNKFKQQHPDWKFIENKIDPNQIKIAGDIAYNGHVSGIVQVISKKRDILKFKQGNILVAPMTTPHYLPAMQKAIAFVTDEGGVTCHAAIVAREMKTPCIIGTKIATQILKDGDFVEVDANRGIVRKLQAEEEIKWHLITQKQYPVFGRFWMLEAFRDEMPKTMGSGFNNFKSLYSGIYADSAEFEHIKNLLVEKLEHDPKEIEKMAKDWQNECQSLIDFSRSLPKNLESYSKDQLIEVAESAIRHFRLSASYIFLHHGLANYFEHWLNDLLSRNRVNEPDKKQYFQILSSPTKNTGLVEASTRLEEILRIEDKKKLAEAVSKHAVNFAWVGYDTGIGHNLTESEVLDQLKNFTKHIHPKTDQSEILSHLKLAKLDKIYLSLMHEILYLGTHRAESHMIAGVNLRRVLEELANRLKSNYEDLVQFTLPEIKQALLSGKRLDTSLAKERRYKFGAVMIKGKISIYSGDKVDEIHEEVSMPTDLQHISGMTAYAGKVKGNAKLVITKADFGKVKNGDIVISKMTSPDFMVILNKCSGIITDIGGITCHAAIISRELHKPCLIGTVYATIFFKDGDLVELDANEGVAKKIVHE